MICHCARPAIEGNQACFSCSRGRGLLGKPEQQSINAEREELKRRIREVERMRALLDK